MNWNKVEKLADFAAKYHVQPSHAYVLPALFERCASMAKLGENELISQAMTNRDLGEYLAGCARRVALDSSHA